MEICSDAVKLMEEYFTSLVKGCKVYNTPIEDIIASMPDKKYGIVFTTSVLEHIHNDSEWIFEDMVRIVDGLIITIEDELSVSFRTFPRNYRRVFEKLGMVQIDEAKCSKADELSGSCVVRVFMRKVGSKE